MKLLISILSVGFLVFNLKAEEQLQPTLTVVASAQGDLATGVAKSKKINFPNNARVNPKPVADKETVEVHILHFVFPELKKNLPLADFLAALDLRNERINKEELITLLDTAGYRPARLEEMMAVRPNLKLDKDVQVYGTTVKEGVTSLAFMFQFEYEIGTDLMAYVDGARPGMFSDDYKWYKQNIYVAAVKKE